MNNWYWALIAGMLFATIWTICLIKITFCLIKLAFGG